MIGATTIMGRTAGLAQALPPLTIGVLAAWVAYGRSSRYTIRSRSLAA